MIEAFQSVYGALDGLHHASILPRPIEVIDDGSPDSPWNNRPIRRQHLLEQGIDAEEKKEEQLQQSSLQPVPAVERRRFWTRGRMQFHSAMPESVEVKQRRSRIRLFRWWKP
jgi:hypothetical protein